MLKVTTLINKILSLEERYFAERFFWSWTVYQNVITDFHPLDGSQVRFKNMYIFSYIMGKLQVEKISGLPKVGIVKKKCPCFGRGVQCFKINVISGSIIREGFMKIAFTVFSFQFVLKHIISPLHLFNSLFGKVEVGRAFVLNFKFLTQLLFLRCSL